MTAPDPPPRATTEAELVALRRFRDAIDRANLAYHAGTMRYDLLTLERAIRAALRRCQDDLDAPDAAREEG